GDWRQTREYWAGRHRRQLERAETEPKHKLAMMCRWYLGLSSRWANSGEPTRQLDYQVWCGPAMGAFNEWTRGTFLERPENRRVVTVGMNILHGAAVLLRTAALRFQGVALPSGFPHVAPVELEEINTMVAPMRLPV